MQRRKKDLVRYRSFEFNLYSDQASFQGDRVLFSNFKERSLLFEVRNRRRPPGPYLSQSIETRELISEWSHLFPKNQEPNTIINGFNSKRMRRFITLSLSEPHIEGKNLSFRYQLNEIGGDPDLNANIRKWDGEEMIFNVSLLIDATVQPQLQDLLTNWYKIYGQSQGTLYFNQINTEAKALGLNVADILAEIIDNLQGVTNSSAQNAEAERVIQNLNLAVVSLNEWNSDPKLKSYYNLIDYSSKEYGLNTLSVIAQILDYKSKGAPIQLIYTALSLLGSPGDLVPLPNQDIINVISIIAPPIVCACNDGVISFGSTQCIISDQMTLNILNTGELSECASEKPSSLEEMNNQWSYPVADVIEVNEFKSSCKGASGECAGQFQVVPNMNIFQLFQQESKQTLYTLNIIDYIERILGLSSKILRFSQALIQAIKDPQVVVETFEDLLTQTKVALTKVRESFSSETAQEFESSEEATLESAEEATVESSVEATEIASESAIETATLATQSELSSTGELITVGGESGAEVTAEAGEVGEVASSSGIDLGEILETVLEFVIDLL